MPQGGAELIFFLHPSFLDLMCGYGINIMRAYLDRIKNLQVDFHVLFRPWTFIYKPREIRLSAIFTLAISWF